MAISDDPFSISTGPSPDFPNVTTANAAGISDGSNPLTRLLGGNTGSLIDAGAAGGALLYDLTQGNQPLPQTQALQANATGLGTQGANLTAQGQNLESYLTSGTLPPALQAAVDQKVAAAKAATVQQAANTTGNANATQNSALTQDLNAVSNEGLTLEGNLEQQLAQTGQGLITAGAQYAGLSNDDLIQLQKIAQEQQQQTGAAITAFAGALGKLAPLALAA